MFKCNLGDRIKIINKYDEILTSNAVAIAAEYDRYLFAIPIEDFPEFNRDYLKTSTQETLDRRGALTFKDFSKYVGYKWIWLDYDNNDYKLKIVNNTSYNNDKGGCFCGKCKNFYDYAIPNQPDGKTMICYSCRFWS